MTWLFFTLISVLFVSVANILQKILMKGDKSNPYSYAIIFQLFIALLSVPVAIVHGFHVPTFDTTIAFFVLAAALWAGAAVFLFKALLTIEASEVIIVSSFRVIVTILVSVFLLGESFSLVKIVGTILLLISIFLVTNLKRGFKLNKGLIYTLVMAVFAGLAIAADGYNVMHYDAISYSVVVNSLVVGILFLCYPKVVKQWKDFLQPDFLKKMLPLGVVSTVQSIAYLLAFATPGVIAQVGTIRQAAVIVTVLLAVLFLGEKNNLLKKIIAAILVTIGVILLS